MKRPWTPGPWAAFQFDNRPDYPKREADNLLASKAPEMAELLIEIAQKATDGIIDDDTYINNMLELGHKAEDLIKEIGYEAPSADRDKP